MGIITILFIVISIFGGIAYHEFGHLKEAKKTGMTVKAYVIGMGKPFFKRKGKDGIEYGLAPFPMGGYCDIPNEDLKNAPFGKYARVLSAGIIRNMIIGFVLCFAGVMLAKGKLVNPLEAMSITWSLFSSSITSMVTELPSLFNPIAMAEAGGMVTSLRYMGSEASAMCTSWPQAVGLGLVVGGMSNVVLGLFNALPIPALDGGSILMKAVGILVKKLTSKEIPDRVSSIINNASIAFIFGIQGLYFLMDVPFVRNLFLRFR